MPFSFGPGLVGTGWIGTKEWTLQERFLYVVPGITLASHISCVILFRLFKKLFGRYKKPYPEVGREGYRNQFEQRVAAFSDSEDSTGPKTVATGERRMGIVRCQYCGSDKDPERERWRYCVKCGKAL